MGRASQWQLVTLLRPISAIEPNSGIEPLPFRITSAVRRRLRQSDMITASLSGKGLGKPVVIRPKCCLWDSNPDARAIVFETTVYAVPPRQPSAP